MTCLKFTLDGTKLITASTNNTLQVIDLRSTKVLYTLEHEDLLISSAINKFAISPNGKYCVIGGHSGTIFIFNLEEGCLEEAYDEEHNVGVHGIDWAAGTSSTIATLDKSGLCYIWQWKYKVCLCKYI